MSRLRCALGKLAVRAMFALAVAFAAVPSAAQVVRVSDIPTPRPRGWSVDLTGQISATALETIDRLGDQVAAELGAEIAVVVVHSIGGANPRRFATDLFSRWGIGDPDLDNGILIFVALEDRNAELILGDGIDEPDQLAVADRIMQQEIVPRFRRGDPSGAVTAAANASVDRILRPLQTRANLTSPPNVPAEAERPSMADPGIPSTGDDTGGSAIPIVGGVAGLLALFGLGRRRLLRYRPRTCARCGALLDRLREVEDDAHLSAAERAEEQVGSVDYDVWACAQCGMAEKLRYGAFFTRYSKCPTCSAKTKNKASKTLRAATYSSGGLVEITESCAHCSYEHVYTRTTPQKTESSSSSSSSSGFSGGSSSGGGASGSW